MVDGYTLGGSMNNETRSDTKPASAEPQRCELCGEFILRRIGLTVPITDEDGTTRNVHINARPNGGWFHAKDTLHDHWAVPPAAQPPEPQRCNGVNCVCHKLAQPSAPQDVGEQLAQALLPILQRELATFDDNINMARRIAADLVRLRFNVEPEAPQASVPIVTPQQPPAQPQQESAREWLEARPVSGDEGFYSFDTGEVGKDDRLYPASSVVRLLDAYAAHHSAALREDTKGAK